MVRESNCKSGIQLVKSDFKLLQQFTTVELYEICWFMMLPMCHLSTISGIGFAVLNNMLQTMSTRLWRLPRVKLLLMSMVSSSSKLVQMWRRFLFNSHQH